MLGSQFSVVELLSNTLQLLVELLIECLVLHSSLVQLLLEASLPHCLVCQVVQLSDMSIRDLSGGLSENVEDLASLVLNLAYLIHDVLLNVSILYLEAGFHMNINLLVKSLHVLLNLLVVSDSVRLLDLLDSIEDKLVSQFNLSLHEHLMGWVLNQLIVNLHLNLSVRKDKDGL
jgi:hypothetical protein